MSADALYTGSKQLFSGRSQATIFNQALQELGLSPQAASYAELAFGLGSSVTAWRIAMKAWTPVSDLRSAKTIGISFVDQATTGIQWGKGIQGQGIPFENYVASTLPPATRLPQNFKTFDFFNIETGVATSVKTLDTSTTAKISNPRQVYSSLKGNINAVANFNKRYTLNGKTLKPADIFKRELIVAVPESTTPAQWEQINNAIQYGKTQNVTVKITVVKP